MRSKLWTISNLLSFSRFILVIPVAVLLMNGGEMNRIYALCLTLIGAATDFLDGYFARKFSQVTELGKIIDPLADKVAIALLTLILMIQQLLPVWFFTLVIIRDVLIFSGGMYITKTKGIVLQSNWLGKWTAAILALLAGITMLGFPSLEIVKFILIIGSVIMIVLSFVSYLKRFLQILNNKQ